MAEIRSLSPATYVRHRLHGPDRTWAETNCYTDVVIELLHGLGFEPMAALPFTLTIDLDVDQWTFFKFPNADVEALYALGTYELAPWRPLAVHIHDHVAAGRPILVELDSHFLPDTQGTAYKLAHVKSTVAVNRIDLERGELGYFHNQGYYELGGQDFVDVLQTEGLVHPRMMPPYIEFLKPLPRAEPLRGAHLIEGSLELLKKHLRRVPPENPFVRFAGQLDRDLPGLLTEELEAFHAYSFATLRQYGACYELASSYLGWLDESGVSGVADARDAFAGISTQTKALQFQLARAMMRKRPFDATPVVAMGEAWERAIGSLVPRFG